jgi:hypothetical protein
LEQHKIQVHKIDVSLYINDDLSFKGEPSTSYLELLCTEFYSFDILYKAMKHSLFKERIKFTCIGKRSFHRSYLGLRETK